MVLMAGAAFGTPQVLPETERYPHPFVGEALASTMFDVFSPPQVVLILLPYIAAGMLLARMRYADPITRRQIGWVAFAIVVNITLTLLNVILEPFGTENRAWLILDSASTLIVMGAMAIAIMKFRLYEINRIISRSVTFGVLAAFIGGVYVGIVVGVHTIIPGAGFWLSIVASVIVAIAFQPARRWVERWANRLVYGERATPYEVLVRFSRRSAELPDDELLSRVPRLIVDGTGASSAALWVRSDVGFRMVASEPADAPQRHLGSDDVFVDPDADYSVPVFHDGELLGGLSLAKPSGESVTPPEQELLADLTSGLGLALRNARLTAQLRLQIAELEASHERVLAASDAQRGERWKTTWTRAPNRPSWRSRSSSARSGSEPSSSGPPGQQTSWPSWRPRRAPRSRRSGSSPGASIRRCSKRKGWRWRSANRLGRRRFRCRSTATASATTA